MTEEHRHQLHAPTAVLTALMCVAIVNVTQHTSLELGVSYWYEALREKPSHELRALVEGHFETTQLAFRLHVQLGDLAPGVTIVLPRSSDLPTEHLIGLGRVDQVVHRDAEVTIDAAVATQLASAVVATGEDMLVGRYAIALPEQGPVEEVVLAVGPERVWLVEAGLLAEARMAVGS